MTRAREIATQGGLVLISSTDFSAVASVSISNIFTTTYSRYRILLSATSSANSAINLQFREDTTNKATNYYQGYGQVSDNGTSTSVGVNNGTQFVIITAPNGTNQSVASLDLLWSATKGFIQGTAYNNQSGNANFQGGRNDGMTNFTGISINTGQGTIAGNIKIYGYK
jgi:hypothetical protein